MKYGITKLGTQVRLPDGRVGTVVYNSLEGIGIKWGLHNPDPKDFEGTTGGLQREAEKPGDWPWRPDAMLRDPSMTERLGMECVCDDSEVEITRIGLDSNAGGQRARTTGD